MYKVTVFVTLKESVLDPQGSAVKDSLHSLNYDEVKDVRIGKYMELEIDAANEEMARERVTEMCEKLLANTVIEDYKFDIVRG
jgi:phosphoribosylformylglycinamidine synthase PurS subunit